MESDVIEMYLGCHSGGWAIDGRTRAWSSHTNPSLALAHWVQEIEQAHAGRWRNVRVTLWLSGGLARPFLCGPVAGLTNWSEAAALAAAVAPEATGFVGPCHVRLEDWPGDVSALGTAIEPSLAQAIENVPRIHRIVWRSVRPRWALLVDEALSQRAATNLVALAEEDAVTLLGGAVLPSPPGEASSSRFELAASYVPAPSTDRMTALWHRTLLSRDAQPDDAWFARLEQPSSVDEPADAGTSTKALHWLKAVRVAEAPIL